MRAFLAEFNVYRWAGRMLVDAARLRRRDRLTGRLMDHPAAVVAARALKERDLPPTSGPPCYPSPPLPVGL